MILRSITAAFPCEACQRNPPHPIVCDKTEESRSSPNFSGAELKPLSPVYPSVFAGSLGCKLQGWLCSPVLSQGEIHLHTQCSTLRLQLWAGVSFFVMNISQGSGPTPSLPHKFIRSVHLVLCFVGGNCLQNRERGTPLSNQGFFSLIC